MVCDARQNFYMLSLYRNRIGIRIYECFLTAVAAVHAVNMRASFLFMGDLNSHHQEWLASTTTNRHGVATLDFATMSGCDQLVTGPTYAYWVTVDLLMTEVPDLVRVAVVAPLGNSDHSSLSAAISMAQLFLTCVLAVGCF